MQERVSFSYYVAVI